MQPLLSILIPCISTRNHRPLIDSLNTALELPQSETFPTRTETVEILTDSSPNSSGYKRHSLSQRATGMYISFVDDDDTVHPEYVSSILNGIASFADVVTFNLAFFKDKKKRETWKFGLYPNHRQSGLMSANHLCAWKKEIATKVSWCPDLGRSDDHLWFEPIHAAKLAKTCYYIDKDLYNYYFSTVNTVNQNGINYMKAKKYLENGIRFFYYKDEIVIEVPRQHVDGYMTIRDRFNTVCSLPISELTEFHRYTL